MHCDVSGQQSNQIRWKTQKSYYAVQDHSRSSRSVDPKFQVEGVATINHSFSQKTRINGLSYGIKIWTDFFRFVTIHAFDGQTDRILIARQRLHSMQRGKNRYH